MGVVGFTYGAPKTHDKSKIARLSKRPVKKSLKEIIRLACNTRVPTWLRWWANNFCNVNYWHILSSVQNGTFEWYHDIMIKFAKLSKVFIKNADTANHSFKAVLVKLIKDIALLSKVSIYHVRARAAMNFLIFIFPLLLPTVLLKKVLMKPSDL